MTSPTKPARPSFFWQGLLIILPVVMLSALGLVSLRQDRGLAEREAEERAAGLAAQLSAALGTAAASDFRSSSSSKFASGHPGRTTATRSMTRI